MLKMSFFAFRFPSAGSVHLFNRTFGPQQSRLNYNIWEVMQERM